MAVSLGLKMRLFVVELCLVKVRLGFSGSYKDSNENNTSKSKLISEHLSQISRFLLRMAIWPERALQFENEPTLAKAPSVLLNAFVYGLCIITLEMISS